MKLLLTFDEYRSEWMKDIEDGNPSNIELGYRFARKIITQWLDIDESTDDIIYCDGSGDGGIDIAYLHRGDSSDSDAEQASAEGDTWYLIQSKYGSAFKGKNTLLSESEKIISTLDGQRINLSSITRDLMARINTFRQNASDLDKLVLVFATEEPLNHSQKRTIEGIRAMGRERIGPIFDVDFISIETIYSRVMEDMTLGDSRVRVRIHGELVTSGKDLVVGIVPLSNLYGFMKAYRNAVGDIDRLYERNVRRFLGSRGKVNKSMKQTLQDNPEKFGLYNNGITIVVEDFTGKDGVYQLVEPYVVNGCQTTRTIWEIFLQKVDAGGSGINAALKEWKSRADQGVVITKIVKVGSDGDKLLENIARYTNSQNAVREKDFLALTSDFKRLAREMGEKYNIFLETQRGGWDSRRAFQKQHPGEKQFIEHANAFDLIKVYGAGWLREPGVAISRNAAFLPNGSIFRRIFSISDQSEPFTVDDFYAAYKIQKIADAFKFGRAAELPSRRQTRFLFYTVMLDLMKGIINLNNLESNHKNITQAIIKLYEPQNEKAASELNRVAVEIIDEYMQPNSEYSVFSEPAYQSDFNNNLVSYLKWEQLGRDKTSSPNLISLLDIQKRTMGRGSPSPKELILNAITR